METIVGLGGRCMMSSHRNQMSSRLWMDSLVLYCYFHGSHCSQRKTKPSFFLHLLQPPQCLSATRTLTNATRYVRTIVVHRHRHNSIFAMSFLNSARTVWLPLIKTALPKSAATPYLPLGEKNLVSLLVNPASLPSLQYLTYFHHLLYSWW